MLRLRLFSGLRAWATGAALATTAFAAQAAVAAPAQVLIIRHAEKPATGNDLSDAGYARAQALVGFFETTPAMLTYGTPVAIYAMAPSSDDGTLRAIETVTPLAQSLGLTLNENYTRKQLKKVAKAILADPAYDGKMVLICWEHTVIPDLVQAFGWVTAPSKWKDEVYDRVWVLNFSGDDVVSFEDLPQHLMPGDSAS